MICPSSDARLRDVIPDHKVSDDPFTREDETLDTALQLIKMVSIQAVSPETSAPGRWPPYVITAYEALLLDTKRPLIRQDS